MQLLETAKVKIWCSLFCQHSFLSDKQTAVDGECYKVLLDIIAHSENKQMPVKHGTMWHSIACLHADMFLGYSDRKHDMAGWYAPQIILRVKSLTGTSYMIT